MRRDLADVRLADRIFAPHYAAPMPRTVAAAVDLRVEPGAEAEILARLEPGEIFEVLELAGNYAWGVAPARKLVGYIDAKALDEKNNKA